MPGICGIIAKSPGAAHAAAADRDRMLACLRYEDSYLTGTFADDALGVWLGWAGHAGTFPEHSPRWNDARDCAVLLHGETYPADAGDHAAAGYLEKLNGWFSGLLLDRRDGSVTLFNDRYGLSRVYYHDTPDAFYFSSEAKSLLKILPALRRLDPRSVGEFFSCGCALENRTLYDGIRLLPGAAAWRFKPGHGFRDGRYFQSGTWESLPTLPTEQYYRQLLDTFRRVLPRYLDGPVGVSLTGGVDSRMIMSWLPRERGALPCYSFNGPIRECADVAIARKVAQACGCPHEIIPVGADFLAQFGALAEKCVFVSDGAMDVTGAVEVYVNRKARDLAPIRLTGNYGGEILRYLVAFGPRPLTPLPFDAGLERAMQQARDTFAEQRRGHRLSFIAFKQVPWHHYARLSVEQSQLRLRSPYLDNDLVACAYQVPPEAATTNDLSLRVIADGNPALRGIPTDRGLRLDSRSLAARLRHQLIELTIKAEYAYDYGMPQWFTRVDRALTPLRLERLFLGRQKFYHFRLWYRRELASYLRDTLLDSRALGRSHVDRRGLERIVNNHVAGRGNHTTELHRLLTMELI